MSFGDTEIHLVEDHRSRAAISLIQTQNLEKGKTNKQPLQKGGNTQKQGCSLLACPTLGGKAKD